MTATTLYLTARFGEITVEPEDIVTFSDGLVGIPDLREFVLVAHKEGSPYRWLQSLQDGTAAFLVIDPGHFVAGYSPELPASAAADLDISADTPILVYSICSIPRGNPSGATLNLAGPIVVNAENRRARQIVLDDADYPVRYSIFANAGSQAA